LENGAGKTGLRIGLELHLRAYWW